MAWARYATMTAGGQKAVITSGPSEAGGFRARIDYGTMSDEVRGVTLDDVNREAVRRATSRLGNSGRVGAPDRNVKIWLASQFSPKGN